MQNRHEPRKEFVETLERRIARNAGRQSRVHRDLRWTPQTPLARALALLVVILVSMGIGGAVVAAAYQSQESERRALLISNFERRAELTRQRLAAANEQLQETERRVALGVAGSQDLLEKRVGVAEAQAQLRSLELQIEEIRLTGREPLHEITSPLVSGRDFVGERLRVEMSVPEAALEVERSRLRETERRRALGTAEALDVEASRARTIEAQAAVEAFRKKIEIRQRFLNGGIDAVEAELRVLEIEAVQLHETLALQVDVARRHSERTAMRVQIGVGQRVDLAEAELRLRELEAELAKVELDLALARRQLEQHGR